MQCAVFIVMSERASCGEMWEWEGERGLDGQYIYYLIHRFLDTTANRWRRFGVAAVARVGGRRLGTSVRRIGIGRIRGEGGGWRRRGR